MLTIYQYKISFSKPFIIANQRYSHRYGLIVAYKKHIAEIAPLEGFSNENFDMVRQYLVEHKYKLEQLLNKENSEDLHSWLSTVPYPSIRYGVSLLDETIPIASVSLKLNKVIGLSDSDATLRKAAHAVDDGYKVLKFKADTDTEMLTSILKNIHSEFPNIRFRLDANQAWNRDKAVKTLNAWSELNLPIEYVEQPLRFDDLKGLRDVNQSTDIPVALDESVAMTDDKMQLLDDDVADIFIIKPMTFGSINEIKWYLENLREHKKRIVFTTALESAVGRNILMLFIAQQGLTEETHGLGTGVLFETDTASPVERISEGKIDLRNLRNQELMTSNRCLQRII
jgi:o-succinylbenzoate synthase